MADEPLYWQSLIEEHTRKLIDLYLNDARDEDEREDDVGQATAGLIKASAQFLKHTLALGPLDFSNADVRVELAFEVGMQFGQILQQAIAAKAAAQAQRLGAARLLRLVPRKSDDEKGGA
jgi:hypothetical protein